MLIGICHRATFLIDFRTRWDLISRCFWPPQWVDQPEKSEIEVSNSLEGFRETAELILKAHLSMGTKIYGFLWKIHVFGGEQAESVHV